ncbi:MAG: hypothetical protein LUD78_12215 [Clostridiales bacterium]|nr:hypothetical protein [Clostridiales bacterium]
MIMVSDLTLNNYTAPAAPSWMAADNFGALLSQQHQHTTLMERLSQLLRTR